MTDVIKNEPVPEDNARVVAASLGKALLASESHAKLSESDLETFGLLQGKDFAEYMFLSLELQNSLQEKAFDRLTAFVPPPVDTDVVYHQAQKSEILAEGEEMELRIGSLKHQDAPLTKIKEESRSSLRNFAYQILSSAGYYKINEDNSFDPDKLKNNIALMEKVASQVPEVITVNGNKCFALYVRREVRSEFSSLVSALIGPPPIENYIVVTDPDKNNELADKFYGDKSLFRYYLADSIERIQREKVSEVENSFSDIASKKYEKIQEELREAELPLQKHFFNLLLLEVAKKRSMITIIFRDDEDVAVLQGKAKPAADRTGSESNAKSFEISSPEDRVLAFDFEGIEISSEVNEKTGRRQRVDKTVQEYVEVRFNEDLAKFEYRARGMDGEMDQWSDSEDKYNGPAYTIKSYLMEAGVFSISQGLQYGSKISGEVRKISTELGKTESATDFCNKLKELKLAGYPSVEYVVNDPTKTKFVFDVFPPQYPQDLFN